MTPMQLLKNSFDEFKKMLPENIKEVALNKVEDRVFSSGCSEDDEKSIKFMKGVRSDFIKYFKQKLNDENSHSIGFSFSYLDKEPSEHTVQVSLKRGNSEPFFYTGDHLSIQKFKEVFDMANVKIKNMENGKFLDIVDVFKDEFDLKLQQSLTQKQAVKRRP